MSFYTLYDVDKRNAERLVNARKAPEGHHLTRRHFKRLKEHAARIALVCPGAKLIGYHRRRRRSRWLMADGTVEEVRTVQKRHQHHGHKLGWAVVG